MSPLSSKEEADAKASVELQTKVEEARKQIKIGKNNMETASASVATMKSIDNMIPKDAAIAWFPPLVGQFFAKRGIPKVELQLRSTDPVQGEGLEQFKYFSWDVKFPPASFVDVAAALSELENEMPLLSVRSFKVDGLANSATEQQVTCEFRTLLK